MKNIRSFPGFGFCTVMLLLASCNGPTVSPAGPVDSTEQVQSSTPAILLPARDEGHRNDTAPSPTEKPFILASPEVAEEGALPMEYTCDGAASTLPLVWSGAPADTRSFAVIMHHVASPTDVHWYWVVYDIPPDVTGLPKNAAGIGTLGNNSVNGRSEYSPPCSKGPGAKTYIFTVYALSAEPQLGVPASQVTRAVLLDAITGITLASAELYVTYTRPFGSDS